MMPPICPYDFCDGAGTYFDRVDRRRVVCICVLDAEAADIDAELCGDAQRDEREEV